MKIEEVFGVSKDPVHSYIERAAVDDALSVALSQSRQIIIYGSSKQGKTALMQRHLPEEKRITVHCGPTHTAEGLYRSILRQQKVEITTDKSSETNRESSVSISAKFTAMLPWVGGGEAETKGEQKAGGSNTNNRKCVEFDLAVAQDIGELLLQVGGESKFYVLENFHYLSEEVQRQLAFDLRTFEEMGLRFVILGVWRERNRLVQYNGDLQDRIAEVPVEPWLVSDFERIVEAGEPALNVKFADAVKALIFEEAHGSVAIVQELLRKTCEKAGVSETAQVTVQIDSLAHVQEAIEEKVREYSARHIRSLESIAAGSRSRRSTEEFVALYLPYYFVLVMVHQTYRELSEGIERKDLQTLIKEKHPAPANVRTSDVTGMLKRLGALQASAKIIPPLFDFDPGTRRVKVVDSTLYFFIDNCDPDDVMDEIPLPSQNADDFEILPDEGN